MSNLKFNIFKASMAMGKGFRKTVFNVGSYYGYLDLEKPVFTG